MNERQTNRQMAESDPLFRQACAAAGLEPSRHHYRRYKHGRGRPAEIARNRMFEKLREQFPDTALTMTREKI
jgi:hypothetical protein